MSDSIKHKASSALFWNFIDKGGLQLIQIAFMAVLMRLLNVEEFGLMAVLTVFTALATILQDGGFYSALVRKKDADESDYSSVFYLNITISISLYLILFFCAPYIANFFNSPILTDLSRVVFLTFVINAFAIIQNVQLTKQLNFKTNSKITFASGVIAGVISVILAQKGFGVWSLAVQLVLQALIRTVLLWILIKWRPTTKFKFERIKRIFKYSVNLTVNLLINQISTKLYTIIIGKYFSINDAAYYDQAQKWNNISQSTIANSIHGVAFPVLSGIDSEDRLRRIYRKIIRITAFISFPVAMILIIAAKPIVTILLTEQFLPIVPYMQILAIGWAFYPLFILTGTLLQTIGKSALVLKIEMTKSILFIIGLLTAITFGITGMVVSFTVVSIISFIYAYHFAGKHISYRIKDMFKDTSPYLVISIISFIPLYWLNTIEINNVLRLILQTTIGAGIYLLIVKILGSQVLNDCLEFMKNKKNL